MRPFILIMLMTACIACTSEKKKTEAESVSGASIVNESTNGEPENAVKSFLPFRRDPAYHYSLYTPKGASTAKRYPVLFLFDPQGDAGNPINRYRSLADKYGIILVASHESKNGNGARETASIIQAMLEEVKTLPMVDSTLMYCSGFSGGGRVASMMGLYPGGIKGIIVCGAGIPAGAWFGAPPYTIIGIAGNSDMNQREITAFKTNKKELMSHYFVIRYDGTHEWPSADHFEFALITLQREAMRAGHRKLDEEFIKASDQWMKTYADKFTNPLEKAAVLNNIIRNTEGLSPIIETEKNYSSLVASAEYRKAKSYDEQLATIETQKKDFYANQMYQKDTIWWRNEMKTFLDTSAFANDRPRVAMIRRVQGTLSLTAYTTLNRAIGAMHKEQGPYFASLYRSIDPQNAEAWYLSAIVSMQLGDVNTAYVYLDQAVRHGFKDINRCRSESQFAALQSTSRFQQIISNIH